MQATASDFPFHDIFAPTKNFSFEVFDDVNKCDLWFAPPPKKMLATPMDATLSEVMIIESASPTSDCQHNDKAQTGA